MCPTAEVHWRCTGGRSANCSLQPAVCPPAASWSHDGRPVKETRKSWNKNNETRSIGVWCSAKFSLGVQLFAEKERLQEISLVSIKFICLFWQVEWCQYRDVDGCNRRHRQRYHYLRQNCLSSTSTSIYLINKMINKKRISVEIKIKILQIIL